MERRIDGRAEEQREGLTEAQVGKIIKVRINRWKEDEDKSNGL